MFEIDNDEFSRINSAGDLTISVVAPSAGVDPLLTLADLDAIAGSGATARGQNIGQDGTLAFVSDGDVEARGNVMLRNATSATRLEVEGTQLVRIDNATGGLHVLDGNGGLAGRIAITAQDFIAATDAAFADIQGMDLVEIDARLALNDGVDRPDGVIRADRLSINTTASRVFVQNTAPSTANDDRRGLTVNSLLIEDSGGTIQPIIINGVVGGLTGVDAINQTAIDSSPDAGSTINGCLISNPSVCTPASGGTPPPPPPPGVPRAPPAPNPPPNKPITSEPSGREALAVENAAT